MANGSKRRNSETLSKHEIISQFNKLRQEQRKLYAELADKEVNLQEYREVLKILKEVNPNRKCFRLSSGILLERSVHETYPSLLLQREMLEEQIEDLTARIVESTKVIQDFQLKYSVRIKPEDDFIDFRTSKLFEEEIYKNG
ncbi:prefoldin subunit 2-like [Stegodyphus dumicola]|uniref:prefoldin subunit 2-like n=1 Tax=Stegodyphus dumicola TaxID=202533 RepID=UPI0015ABC461|nr:prefoldin subunit 2-like [Stegodyphus dumicola]